MAADKSNSVSFQDDSKTGRHDSPDSGRIRQRPLSRTPTARESSSLNRRTSSLFSEGMSESRRSFLAATDDLLHPRPDGRGGLDHFEDSSHWQSVPLALALLPAVGGLVFQNGNVLLTDATTLALAAIFLNWSIRLPWSWYHAAQSVRTVDPYCPPEFEVIEEEDDEDGGTTGGSGDQRDNTDSTPKLTKTHAGTENAALKAQKELGIHELLALFCCFLGPALGAWLLHAIRAQLSRPSEGLVSDYNLTIFLLATEVRPLAHLMKMVQKRTLYLQKAISDAHIPEPSKFDNDAFSEVMKRIEELERYTANAATQSENNSDANSEVTAARATAQATSELRKGIQPDLDALNRAVRRYEKRTTISAIQTEARLQDLENRLKDVVVLAAAAQRNVENQPRNYIVILTNWVCGAIVLPVHYTMYLLSLPSRALTLVPLFLARQMGMQVHKVAKDSKTGRQGSFRARERKMRADS